MLITDLEESQKRISEFSAEIVAIKAKKDFFSESLAVQDEFVRVQGPI
jgi:golgin subfamily B member 1